MGMSLALSSVRLDPLYNNIANLFGGAKFVAPLTHSVIPTSAATGTTATFTRATTATVRDNEGVLRTAVAGEARFEGARRVRNLLTYTEDFSNAAWVASNVTKASGVSDPLGTSRAGTITATANNGLMYQAVTPPAATGYVALNSVYIRRRTGTGAIYFRTANNVDVDVTSSVTTSWTRIYSTPTAPAAGTWYFVVKLATSGDAVDVYAPQLEDITGRADQTTPSEYVSVGVEAAPYYHGSFVDGVKCFPTDLSGNPLTTMERYKSELAATTKTFKSRALSDAAWLTFGTQTRTQNALGADGGPATGWTLADTDAAVVSNMYQSHTLTAANYTDSYLVKKTTGAQATYPVFWIASVAGTNAALMTVDTTNGVATVWTAFTGYTIVTSSARCSSYNSDYWLVELTFLASAANWYQIISYAGTANATQSTGTLASNLTGNVVLFDAQRELGSKATSRILNTAAAADATRNADILTYSGGDIPNLKTLMAGFRREVGPNTTGFICSLDDGTTSVWALAYLTDATNVQFAGQQGGTQWGTNASNAYTPGANSKVAWSQAANDIKMAKDGVAQTQDTSATVPTTTVLSVGHYGGGQGQLNGNVGGIYGWTRNFSQSELNAVTA